MLERTLVYVDTSYLLASFYNSWATGARAQLEIDLPEVVTVLGQMIEAQLGQPIQRQFWYDGIPDSGPHRYQRALRTCDGVQLRAGQLIEWGERRTQKAVDTRLVADMVTAGLRGQCSDMVLVSGDADMIPGVQEATAAGIRVHLYGFGWDSMSSALRHACDSTTILDPREDFVDCMQLQVLEGPLPPTISKPIGDAEPLEEVGPTTVPGYGETTGEQSGASSDVSNDCDEDAMAKTPTAADDCAKQSSAKESAAPNEGGTPPSEDAVEPAKPVQPKPAAPSSIPTPMELIESERTVARMTTIEVCDGEDSVSVTRETLAAERTTVHERTSEQPATKPDVVEAAPVETPEPAVKPGDTAADADEPGTTAPSPSAMPQRASIDTERPKPTPSMMAPRRKLRSRYVPLPNEVWASAGFQTPYDVGQQYASWWYSNAATAEQRDNAHMLSGGGLPPEIDRPLLQFACETLHEYTLNEAQRVSLRDGFHSGIRAVLLNNRQS